jgi:5' nucleotidase, deoxy (Pyrimidine), cytosolic type C protein (NT5C)
MNYLHSRLLPFDVSSDYYGRVFFDMDGVLADFQAHALALGVSGDVAKISPGFYRDIPPIPDGVRIALTLLEVGVDVWIATKISHRNPFAATEKLQWVETHMPQFLNRTIITPHKGMLSTRTDDVLIDDRPHKAFVSEFQGFVIPLLSAEVPSWVEGEALLREFLSKTAEQRACRSLP